MSSQMGSLIEKISLPGTQHKRDRDTFNQTLPPKQLYRKKKVKTTQGAHGPHTAQSIIHDVFFVPSQTQVDVAPVSVESQPNL